jgi:hypothetical protein
MRDVTPSHMLPDEVTQGASLRGNEYGWKPSEFPKAVARAESQGFACLGGQFQYRLADGSTCEMYWLKADATERRQDEPWADYVRRSCTEVMERFTQLAANADFTSEASNWPSRRDVIVRSLPNVLIFVAYFVTESEYVNLRKLT